MTNWSREWFVGLIAAKMAAHKMSNRRMVAIAFATMLVAVISITVLASAPQSGHSPSTSRLALSSPVPTATPTATPPPSPSPTPLIAPPPPPPPAYVGFFTTLPVGAALPGDALCAREVAPNGWEPRPQNATANRTNVYAQGFRFHSGYFDTYGPAYGARVTGNFSGTTDQILRWAACKWGFDEDTVRAQAVVESTWFQSTLGDCNGGSTQPETHGCASVGILQVKGADIPATFDGTWPAAWKSTAFNADFAMANRRLCFEGKVTWLAEGNPSYKAGDLWGCIGSWFSGRWHDSGAEQYIQHVQAVKAAKVWTTWR
jgi:autotransporter family porin